MFTHWISELRRRRVFRVAVIYGVAAWAAVQGAGAILPMLGAPAWVGKVVLATVAFGFPITMAFAWAFDITPDGIRRTSDEATADQPARAAYPYLNTLSAALIVGAIAFLGGRFFGRPHTSAALNKLADTQSEISSRSVAVLPFVNMSADPTEEYFSDGITEEILNALAQIPGLQVAGRTSSFAYKGKNQNLSEIGKALRVGNIVEGSIQRAGDQVRITAQLIDTRTDYHLWSKTYDRELKNVFAVEDEISTAIAKALSVKLGAGPALSQGTNSIQAHDLYLRAIANIADRGPALRNAVALLSRAVQLDSTYAVAWAALSQAQELLPWYDLADWAPSLDRADAAARRALALDPNVDDAHVGLAMVLRDRLQLAEAKREYEAALKLDPNSVEGHNQYAQMLNMQGRFDEALRQARTAVALDPLAPNPRYVVGQLLVFKHAFNDAIAELRIDVRQRPDYVYGRYLLAFALLYANNYREAEQQARVAAAQAGEDPEAAAKLIRAVADPAQRPAALAIIDKTESGRIVLGDLARPVWFSLLGDHQRALAGIEAWARHTEPGRLYSHARDLWQPAFDPIRKDARFQEVQRKLGMLR